jgi:tight adherence protein C
MGGAGAMQFPIDDPVFSGGLVVLGMSLLMLMTGVALIVVGARMRAQKLARRVGMAHFRAAPAEHGKEEKAARSKERLTPDATAGLTGPEHQQIIRLFSRFGVAPERALRWFYTIRIVLTLVLAVAAVPLAMRAGAKQPAAGLLVDVIGAAIGWFLPMIVVRKGVSRHLSAISAGLPDALELLAVCVEAGLSLENALQRVSREMKRTQPELSEELATTWAEINILPNRDQALSNFAERVDLPAVRSVVTTLLQTLRYGTPLAKSLRVVAADVRGDQLTAMEEKANRLPALMTVPVMLFIMPTIFLIVGGPAALKMMDIFFKR